MTSLRDDRLERERVRLLEDRVVAPRNRGARPLVDVDDRVRRDVLRVRRPVVLVETGRRLVHAQDLVTAFEPLRGGGVGLGCDLPVREEIGDAFEITGVDPFGVGVQQVLDGS